MQQHKFNIGDIVWVKYNITEYGDSIRTRIISDILVTNNWQGDISYFFLWTDKPSPIYENEIVWLYQKSSPSSDTYIWKNVKAFKCHKNWRELWALDDYPLWVYLVEEIVSENKLWFYFRSWDIICQFYSDAEEIIKSEDKPVENEQGFWEAIMLLKDVRQYATDMTSHADSYEAQSAYKKYKKLLSILENKIFTI